MTIVLGIIGAIVGLVIEVAFSLPDIVVPSIDAAINSSSDNPGIVLLLYLLKILVYLIPPATGGGIGLGTGALIEGS